MTTLREPAEPKRRIAKIAALCVVLVAVVTIFSLTCKMRALRVEAERLDAAYQSATEAVRETTTRLEAILDDLESLEPAD